MAKRATATNWEVITRDDEGAMVNIDFDCPHCGYSTGVFIMVFEYDSLEAHHAYKERRKNWDGPYEAYKKVDPYQEFFDLETVTTEYWQPLETEQWAQFK